MAGITAAQAEARLTEYLAAEAAVLEGKQVKLGDRMVTREDLPAIQQGIEIWDARVRRLTSGGGIRIFGGTPT